VSSWDDVPAEPTDEEIDAGAFFPAVSTAVFRETYRIPAELPAETVRTLLRLAVLRVRSRLNPYRARMAAAGYGSLAEVPQEGDEKLLLWKRAVSCEAKAELLRETVTVDRKPEAENAAKSAPETEREYKRLAALAIRELSGRGAITAETI